MPFFRDLTPQVRFLFSLPLLILADLIVGPTIVRIGSLFLETGLVRAGEIDRYEEIAKRSIEIRDSRVAELIVLAIAYATAVMNINREIGAGNASWLMAGSAKAFNLTAAGWYYALISVPIYQFFLFRWIMRFGNWAVFLFRMSRLDLQIIPTHPDGAAGLGFVGQMLAPISVILLAASCVLCSSIGMQVVHSGAKLQDFIGAFAIFVIIAIFAFVTPFAVFIPRLVRARREGLATYGSLATRYTQLFDRKWVKGEAPAGEEFLGTADIQSLADIANSFDRIAGMKMLPVDMKDLRALLIAALLPAIPLALTQFSPRDLLQVVQKVLL